MSVFIFDKRLPLIVVPVSIKKGAIIYDFNFAIDTGASVSLIDMEILRAIGYENEHSIRTVQTMTASQRETAYEFEIDNIQAIGLIRRNFKVISRVLPAGLGIDGLLGLNFFRNKELVINFKTSKLHLS
jgi:predicted aspartyl protease